MNVDFNDKALAPLIDAIREAVKEEAEAQELHLEPEVVELKRELYHKAINETLRIVEGVLRHEFGV